MSKFSVGHLVGFPEPVLIGTTISLIKLLWNTEEVLFESWRKVIASLEIKKKKKLSFILKNKTLLSLTEMYEAG